MPRINIEIKDRDDVKKYQVQPQDVLPPVIGRINYYHKSKGIEVKFRQQVTDSIGRTVVEAFLKPGDNLKFSTPPDTRITLDYPKQ